MVLHTAILREERVYCAFLLTVALILFSQVSTMSVCGTLDMVLNLSSPSCLAKESEEVLATKIMSCKGEWRSSCYEDGVYQS
jgi:hypothetical protein